VSPDILMCNLERRKKEGETSSHQEDVKKKIDEIPVLLLHVSLEKKETLLQELFETFSCPPPPFCYLLNSSWTKNHKLLTKTEKKNNKRKKKGKKKEKINNERKDQDRTGKKENDTPPMPSSEEGTFPQTTLLASEWLGMDWSDPTVQLDQKQVLREVTRSQLLDVTEMLHMKSWYEDPFPPRNEIHRNRANHQRDAKASDLHIVLALDTLGSIDDLIHCFLLDTFPLPEREIWIRRFRSDVVIRFMTSVPPDFMDFSPPLDVEKDGLDPQFVEDTYLRWIWVLCCFWKYILEKGHHLRSQERWASLFLLISWGETTAMDRCLKTVSDPFSPHRHWLSLAFPSCFTWARQFRALVKTLYSIAPFSPFWGFHHVEQQKGRKDLLCCSTTSETALVPVANEDGEIESITSSPLDGTGRRKETSNKRKRTSAEEDFQPIECTTERESSPRETQKSELEEVKEELEEVKEELEEVKEELLKSREIIQQAHEEWKNMNEEWKRMKDGWRQAREEWKQTNETWNQRMQAAAARCVSQRQKETEETFQKAMQSEWTEKMGRWKSQLEGIWNRKTDVMLQNVRENCTSRLEEIWKQKTEVLFRHIREEWNSRTADVRKEELEKLEHLERRLEAERRRKDEEETRREAERQQKRDEAFVQREIALEHMLEQQRQWTSDMQNRFENKMMQTMQTMTEQSNQEVRRNIEEAGERLIKKEEEKKRNQKESEERKQKEVEERLQERIEEEVEKRLNEEKEKQIEEERKRRKEREEQACSLLCNFLDDDLLSCSREPESDAYASPAIPFGP